MGAFFLVLESVRPDFWKIKSTLLWGPQLSNWGPKKKLKERKRAPCTTRQQIKSKTTERWQVFVGAGFRPGNDVRLSVYCCGVQWNVIAVNNEVANAVNCRGVTQQSSRCGRRVRRHVFFKFCPLLALLLLTRRRRLARRRSTAAAVEFDHRFSRRSIAIPLIATFLICSTGKWDK